MRQTDEPESPVETISKFTYDEESENPLHGDETVHGIVERHHAATIAARPLVTDAENDGAENPLFGDEEVHSVVDRVHANTPRAIYFEPDPERDAADMKIWAVLKSRSWGSQLATLCGKGWMEPEPSYADLESQLARRIFVMEHGFGRMAKVEKTKRGFRPSSIEFVDGGRKSIVLRAQGKEMGTPWLISPALEPISAYQDLLDAHSTPSKKSSSVKTVDPPATPEQDRADRQQWSSLQRLGGWGKQLAALKKDGWVEPDPDYNTIDQNLGDRLFVMDLGFGKLVKVEQKKRGWGPCKIDFAEGGEKLVILRLLGKEMGTPFLVAPAQPRMISNLQSSPEVVPEGVPPAHVTAPVDSTESSTNIVLQQRVAVSPAHTLPQITCRYVCPSLHLTVCASVSRAYRMPRLGLRGQNRSWRLLGRASGTPSSQCRRRPQVLCVRLHQLCDLLSRM